MKQMFKSKGFTVAFSILSLIAVALAVVFVMLITNPSRVENLIPGGEKNSTAAPSSETDAPVIEVRGLLPSEEHEFPLQGELIPEKGKIRLTDQGQATGVTFHKAPAFDGKDAEGNIARNSGTYEVDGKIFVPDKNSIYMMYHTTDGYYVTSSPTYVVYSPEAEPNVTPDSDKIKKDGYRDENDNLLNLIQEDGNHLSFSLYETVNGVEEPVLENMIASYDAFGSAHFEYKLGMEVVKGRITFSLDGDAYRVTVRFDEEIPFRGTTVKELTFK